MHTNRALHLALALYVGTAIFGCSSSEKPESGSGGANGLGGKHGSAAGSSFGGLGAGAGTGGAGSGAVAGAGAGGSLGAGGSGVAGLGLGGASIAGNAGALAGAAGTSPGVTNGGTAPGAGGPNVTGGGTAGSSISNGGAASNIVWTWGKQGNEGLLADEDWVVDSVRGAYEGATAAHPPPLVAATPVELTIDCGAQAHTELSFYLAKSLNAPSLDFIVDGTLRHQFRSNDGTWSFRKYTFDVAPGVHTYGFRASSSSDAATSFALDSIVCTRNPPIIASNFTVDFDRGFVPPETGGWLVDNAIGTYSDGSATTEEAAIHPPALQANTPVDMTFDCGKADHTELSFYLAKLMNVPSLDLLVDGALRYRFRTNVGTWPFEKFVFDVPQGPHTYTFRAQSTSDAWSSFVVDFMQCKNVTPVVAPNASVDFDDGFVPPETGGGWFVDNAIGTYSDGSATPDEAAIHPPALLANTPVEMTFDCGKATHKQLTFYLAKFANAPSLDFLVDDTLRHQLPTNEGTWPFTKYVFDVPQGPHTYTFRAQSATDAVTSFAVDFLQCTP